MTKKNIYDSVFILIVTTICHFLFSKYGFNPTDEGFVLSSSNRLLHGQIPHVDFSSVRPLGYAYLHIPELLISKKQIFLVSRFVFWFEQVLIAFFWIQFLKKTLKVEITTYNKYLFTIICFIFNVHYFPASVLHTIDGLLMCILGLNLVISSQKKWNYLGYFLIGFAALCKQNYLIVLPITLLLFHRINLWKNFIFGLLPIIIYVGIISIYGGFQDFCIQLGGHHELLKVGLFSYLFNPIFLFVFFLFLSLRFLSFRYMLKDDNLDGIFKNLRTLIIQICIFYYLILMISNHYHGKWSYMLVAILAAELVFVFLKKCGFFGFVEGKRKSNENEYNSSIYIGKEIKIALITLVLTWCVSISVGYNTPALFIGGCISWFMFISNKYAIINDSFKPRKIIELVLIIIYCSIFIGARYIYTYRDSSLIHLNYKLDNIVKGANGIYTNKNNFLVLTELDSLKKSNPNLIALPDFTACNIMQSHRSKILTEWPNKTEIPNDKILKKIISKIENDSNAIYAIPIFQTALLKDGFMPLENSGLDYPIIRWIKQHYPTKKYVNYFEIRSKE